MAYASIALDEADLIIAIGSRFDDRIVGNAKGLEKTLKRFILI